MSVNSSSPTGFTFSLRRFASPTSSVGGSVYDSDAVEAATAAAAASVLGSLSTSWSSEFPAYLTRPVLTPHLCTNGLIDPLDVVADQTEVGDGASAGDASE
jgi:hypothetical protein